MSTLAVNVATIVTQAQTTIRNYSSGEQVYDYFGMTSPRHFGPEAFLGDLRDHVTRSHFHPVDSFNLFWGAEGAEFQGKALPKVLLHYSDAYGIYGPFSATENRMQCFTLRPESSAFTAYMIDPDRREFVPARRHFDSNVEPLLAEDPPSGATVKTQTLIPAEADGLAAYLVTAGHEAEIPPELVTSPNSSGSYVCVLSGQLDWGGVLYGLRSLAWVPPGGVTPALRAFRGADGPLRVIVMHFPSPLTSAALPFEA